MMRVTNGGYGLLFILLLLGLGVLATSCQPAEVESTSGAKQEQDKEQTVPSVGKSILSCADAIASVLEKHTTGYDGKPKQEDYGLSKNLAGQCPECSNMLIYQEGCFICPACGYTKC